MWIIALFCVTVTVITKPLQFYKHDIYKGRCSTFGFYPSLQSLGFRVYNCHQNSEFLMEIKHLIGSCFMCRFVTQQGSWLFGKDIIYYSVIWNSSPYFPGPLTTPLLQPCAEILKTILHGIKKISPPTWNSTGLLETWNGLWSCDTRAKKSPRNPQRWC